MRVTKLFAALVAILVMLSACSTVKLDPKAPIEDRANKSSSANQSSNGANTGAAGNGSADSRTEKNNEAKQAADKAAAAAAASAADPLNDVAGILSKRSVYFDFDSYIIKDEFKAIVEAHSQYLTTHTDRKVVIQGNTDERGGSEYNLALGQKRAEAVRRALSLLGVSDTQMEAVSFGKEKPKALGSNEAAWAENRRADLAY